MRFISIWLDTGMSCWYLGSMDYFVSYISRLDTSFTSGSGFLGSGVYSISTGMSMVSSNEVVNGL